MAIKRIRHDGPPISGDGYRWDYRLYKAIEALSQEQKAMRDEKLKLAAFFDRNPDVRREFATSMRTMRPKTPVDLQRAMKHESDMKKLRDREQERRREALRQAQARGEI